MRLKLVDLFCGAGGLSLGFRDAGFEPVLAADWDEHACRTYEANLGSHIHRQEARIWARFYAMLAGGYAQNRRWRESLYWGWRALIKSPLVSGYFMGLPIRRLRRRIGSQQGMSFASEFS